MGLRRHRRSRRALADSRRRETRTGPSEPRKPVSTTRSLPLMAARPSRVRTIAVCAFGLAGLLRFSILAAADSPGWPQWGRNPQHQGAAPAAAQPLEAILADVVYDPFVAAEAIEGGGQLNVHYAAPLVEEGGVYIEVKTGTYIPCGHGSSGPTPCGAEAWGLQVWNVEKLTWQDGVLTPAWTFTSDWKPEP